MKRQYLKYYIGIALLFIFDVLFMFVKNDRPVDIYLFFDYKRDLTLILYDISGYFRFSILTFWLISLNRKIFRPLFLMSIFAWITYFIDYSQTSSSILMPIYILFVITHNRNIFK